MVLIGTGTVPGTRYGTLNQDYVLTDVVHSAADLSRLSIPQCYIALVLDGHGMLGEECAKEAGQAIMKALKASPFRAHPLSTLSPEDVEKILVDAFHVGHEASMRPYSTAPRTYSYPKQAPEERRYTLIQHRSGHTVYSHPIVGPRLLEFGTTATAVVVQGRTAVFAHAGDSLIAIGHEDANDSYSGEFVTEGHCGTNADERHRLEQQHTTINATTIGTKKVTIRTNDGYICVPCPGGPVGTFSLAMSRALGHKMMADYGVIPTPTVSIRQLAPQDVCIIVATDGVWEGLDADEAVRSVCDLMSEGRSADSAAQELCKSAVARVHAVDKRNRADNSTAALIIFDQVGNRGEEVVGNGVENGNGYHHVNEGAGTVQM